ncbi:SDR family oxidoreductase [Microvirga zambiensis]|uniref:SDR family NAD(P)-dependent oxidoreductase n=1 Tax=Microvirga zambiensis TaxID=1402137 RepID=UPI00191EC37F
MSDIERLLRLDGRVAAITGGAQGIGLAIARRLAQAGAKIALGDLSGASAQQAAETLATELGEHAIGLALDVRDEKSVVSFADQVEATLGPIAIWVNNAGIYPIRHLVDMDAAEWDLVNDVNLRGTFLGAREAARRMIRSEAMPGRVILNIASVSSCRGRPGLAHYVASKHGALGLTRSLAVELGPRGIRVLAVAPTLVVTPGLTERKESGGRDVENLEVSVANGLPLGRIAQPDDVANAALFCVSDMASLVTGSTVFVDAGATA